MRKGNNHEQGPTDLKNRSQKAFRSDGAMFVGENENDGILTLGVNEDNGIPSSVAPNIYGAIYAVENNGIFKELK